MQDRGGDTNLIHAAKAGHKSIVEALLKKYADVDMTGKVLFQDNIIMGKKLSLTTNNL